MDGRTERIECVDPMGYLSFFGAIGPCRLILSDSGGAQEEAPSQGKRVLVAREHTERPDALAKCWDLPPYKGELPAPNPYGDGRSGERIVDILRRDLGSIAEGVRCTGWADRKFKDPFDTLGHP